MAKKILDHNPDKESHATHGYMVTKTTRRNVEEVSLGGKTMKYGKEGSFWLKDEGEARELEKEYGADQLMVTRFRKPDPADRGHKYFFGQMPEMPWKKKEREE